jgi:hypothetical protein
VSAWCRSRYRSTHWCPVRTRLKQCWPTTMQQLHSRTLARRAMPGPRYGQPVIALVQARGQAKKSEGDNCCHTPVSPPRLARVLRRWCVLNLRTTSSRGLKLRDMPAQVLLLTTLRKCCYLRPYVACVRRRIKGSAPQPAGGAASLRWALLRLAWPVCRPGSNGCWAGVCFGMHRFLRECVFVSLRRFVRIQCSKHQA